VVNDLRTTCITCISDEIGMCCVRIERDGLICVQ